MKNLYYLLMLTSFVILTSSCKVRYGAHFQKVATPSYLQENQVRKTIPRPPAMPPAEDLLVSSDTKNFIPTEAQEQFQDTIARNAPDELNQSDLVRKINRSINEITPAGKSLDISGEPEAFISGYKNLERADRKKVKREIKKLVKKELKSQDKLRSFESSPLATESHVLLIILAILLPPLAVGLHEGALNNTFWLNLLLTLLFYIPGMVHALIVVTR